MPGGLEPTMELIELAGLVTSVAPNGQPTTPASERQKELLLQTVKAFCDFTPKPMSPSKRPGHTCMIWVKKSLSETLGYKYIEPEIRVVAANVMEDPETGLKSWFHNQRTNFRPNGWDGFVGGDLECFVMEEADHFTMVRPPQVRCTVLFPGKCHR